MSGEAGRLSAETEECPAQTGPVWKLGGEPCGCTLPAGHEGDHECSCGSWWVDSIRRDVSTPPGPSTPPAQPNPGAQGGGEVAR